MEVSQDIEISTVVDFSCEIFTLDNKTVSAQIKLIFTIKSKNKVCQVRVNS